MSRFVRLVEQRAPRAKADDWRYCAVGVAIISLLVIAAVAGHHWVAQGLAR